MKILNLGILAHVDAGKTSLSERLLFNRGVISSLGSVDQGNTQTDTMYLERQRGITIRSAVVSFNLNNLKVNLIDTPGHPDFIAEVERALSVLDQVILVVSAVEGVQAQTRVLFQTIKKLKIPTIIFINKIDRLSAKDIDLINQIEQFLNIETLVCNMVHNLGTQNAYTKKFSESQDQTDKYPLIFGSALTGAGIEDLLYVLGNSAESKNSTASMDLSAKVFKIEKDTKSEKIVFARIFKGTLYARRKVKIISPDNEVFEKINSLQIFENGITHKVDSAFEGDIVKVYGLQNVRIGDWLGSPLNNVGTLFPQPSLEVIIKPKDPVNNYKLFKALEDISQQDPLILFDQNQNLLSIKLYGEVQKEVIQKLLLTEYGIEVMYENPSIIYIEKLIGDGSSFTSKFYKSNYFAVTLGLEIGLGENNSAIKLDMGVALGSLPLSFQKAIEESVYKTLKQGLFGWRVTDCVITITHAGYWSGSSTAVDFRGLVPLLLMEALVKAGTRVYEPINKFELKIPRDTLSRVLQKMNTLEAQLINTPESKDDMYFLFGTIPVRKTFELKSDISNLTYGMGMISYEHGGYRKVIGSYPTKQRSDFNPLNKQEYMRHILRGD